MLTGKQEKFVQNLIKGMSQREAYRDAYPDDNSSDKTVDENACRLFNDSKILTRYKELQDKASTKAIMSAIERKEVLTNIILNENVDSKMKAIDILNKMDGEYIQKIQADVDNHIDINIEIDDVDE